MTKLARGAPAVLLALSLPVAAGAQQLLVRAEPGIALPGEGALLPFRLADSSGVAFPVRAGEMAVESDGGPLSGELVRFEGPEAEGFRVHLLVDTRPLAEADPSAWSDALARFARTDGTREERAIYGNAGDPDAWAGTGMESVSSEDLRKRVTARRAAPLWDGILRALDRLGAPGPPARRVLVVITDGEEEEESRHPVATCADAADTARVSVWLVSPATPSSAAARARLSLLASRTGGEYVDARGRGAAVLDDVLRRIRSVQAIRLATLPSAPPFAVTLRPGVAAAAPARAWIRERRELGLVGKPFPWLAVGGALGVALLAGGLVLQRKLAVGTLRLGESEDSVPVTRSGLTIGAAVGNGFVVAHPRVSRNHAVIRCEKGRVVLVDLRSANGTKVNGRTISSAALRDGDRIVLAEAVELIFEEGFRFGKRG